MTEKSIENKSEKKNPGCIFAQEIEKLDFPVHPGGQANLDCAKDSKRPDLLFQSYHLGRNWSKIAAAAAKHLPHGTSLMPAKSKLFEELDQAARYPFSFLFSP